MLALIQRSLALMSTVMILLITVATVMTLTMHDWTIDQSPYPEVSLYGWLQFNLNGFDQTRIYVVILTETTESKPVKLETSHTLILSLTVIIPWSSNAL